MLVMFGALALDHLFPPNLTRYQEVCTEILARDGSPLAAQPAAGGIWRLRTRIADVDPRYIELLLAAEDRHFRSHSGIDPASLARAAWQWLENGRIVSGGSTLTMQVARLLEPHPRGVIGKLHDMARALQLERRYSKEQILDIYLTLAPFGANIEGARAASAAWLGHAPNRLTPAEIALLVTLPQQPGKRRPDRGAIAAQAAMTRLAQRLHRAGAAPDWLPEKPALPTISRHDMPREAGLFAAAQARHAPPGSVLRTTIDITLQRRLEKLLARDMEGVEPQIGVAAMIVRNADRQVLASVGGRGAGFAGAALDLTSTRRSPGSALKPFIYGMAFDSLKLHPLTLIPDAPDLVAGYAPHNFDYAFHGAVTAQTALRQSFNVPAVEVLSQVGAGRFIAGLRQAGASIALPGNRPSLAVALGGLAINLRDMVMLYAALGNDGMAAPLVTTPDETAPRHNFMGERAVYYLRQILQGSPPPPGMAYPVLTGARSVAFKTGTSYGFRDAWAVGYDSAATVGVWTGRVDGTPRPGAFGRATAAPLMLDIFSLLPPDDAAEPPPPASIIAASSTQDFPPALRRLGAAPKAGAPAPSLAYPPAGSVVDLIAGGAGRFAPVDIEVSGGAPPFRWLVNGAPVPGHDTVLHWTPDGPGAVSVRVLDGADRAAGGTFELKQGQ